MERRVTLRQVAKRAGVHLSTVSLALRDDQKLPEATRRKLQKLAREMGYVPDAAMSALCAYRNAVRPRAVQSGLAYLTDDITRRGGFGADVYRYARTRAAELGYNLIEYNLSARGASLERFRSIWWNTGLRGVLIGPFARARDLGGEWERWPVAAFGYSLPTPQFNRAAQHHFQNMLLHLQALRELGYRRIGLCLLPGLDVRTEGQLRAAYLLDQDTHRGRGRAPAILAAAEVTAEGLDAWVRTQRLDAVIGYKEHHRMLVEQGWDIPGELGFSLLALRSYERARGERLAGFDSGLELIAAAAVNFLVSLIHEQAFGLCQPPRYYLISGEFVSGDSLRLTERAAVRVS